MQETLLGALGLAPQEFAQEMRLAAAVQWYAQGIVSRGKAAGLAGLSRMEFLEELHRRKVAASLEELQEEMYAP